MSIEHRIYRCKYCKNDLNYHTYLNLYQCLDPDCQADAFKYDYTNDVLLETWPVRNKKLEAPGPLPSYRDNRYYSNIEERIANIQTNIRLGLWIMFAIYFLLLIK